ncbi:pirin family protein [Halomonas sp. MCCC 1A17488]|uniref:Pirin family protein n=1 Tax=Billgrantia sulfidoxydans TaxID=2733484 RepID=A0ABX7W3P2_9GAMM|nr:MULTISPECIES: pirin family protein [Halomonas]MCE8015446.1 pirin family protein [Halomonas sp. MCCC 1A17488]MCG3238779.1 pirin family protein [Halomonas sp. MCCC 1A17488]QPP51255.1 pirin family protein [Halomonas sp. SS10-MC5]QTP54813.1 pirin family protein [Halomonas sulfidoxydans]
MKKIHGIYGAPRGHWVGDGFPVRSLFAYDRLGADHLSPFLLLDHAGPHDFAPASRPRGVGAHPHRGFETVTLVYQGELEHRDSTGSGGRIGEGDVQWMTAGAGIVHEEFHSSDFTQQGGTLEMVQLWVNLPAEHKSAPAAYQTLLDADIPRVALPGRAGELRVIAGRYGGQEGPAHTFTPIEVWDLRLAPGGETTLRVPEGHTTLLVVLEGTVQVNGDALVRDAGLVCFERRGDEIRLEANNDAKLLLLAGVPLDEPVVGYGPFVMNSEAEIHQAFADFQAGKFGRLEG